MADALGAAAMAESITVPPVPRLIADDITPEAAASLLADQGGQAAIFSAEGGLFDIIAGRYSQRGIPNYDLWLKAHSGDPVRIDRKSRAPEYIPRPAITLGLMIQPRILAAIAGNPEFRGRGLLARFLYAYPASKVGRRVIPSTPVHVEIERAYATTVGALAAGMVGWAGGDRAVLTLSLPAQAALLAVERAVEPTLAGDGELATLADWGGKYVGAVARIAGMLHLAEHGAEGVKRPVSKETIEAAAAIGEYYKGTAINAFAEMGTDQGTADAVYLLHRIERLGQETLSERDIHVAGRSRFPTKVELAPALERLIDNGYLIPLPANQDDEKRPGRRPSPLYNVRTPHIAHKAQNYADD